MGGVLQGRLGKWSLVVCISLSLSLSLSFSSSLTNIILFSVFVIAFGGYLILSRSAYLSVLYICLCLSLLLPISLSLSVFFSCFLIVF